ncbi:MAG: MerR family transcriptional regulator [Alphaproteobacteria bacterium]|nr:MerR family transcriptional regulator [Alphaproteobacteria bacterium]
MHTIGEVARLTGLKIPTIRFYEAEGLVPAPPRTESGRRLYADAAVRRLAFIRHARGLGFELDDIRSLLDLTDAPDRPCADADQIARRHLAAVEVRIAQLEQLRTELSRIARACAGGRPVAKCRVIEALSDASAPQRVPQRRAARKVSGR